MLAPLQSFRRHGVALIPMLWLGVLFLLPFLFLFVLSFSTIAISRPPYEAVFALKDGILAMSAHMESWARLITDPIYIETYISSLFIAFIATISTLFIGFPMAYLIARAPDEGRRNIYLMLVILPFWTSFLLRVYALKTIFYNQGPINVFLGRLGLIDAPIQFLNTDFAVILGITYTYLPFMVLPLYANLVKLENETLEAAADLGARPFHIFWQIVVPLAIPGIIAGSMLVFIPAVGEFVIPDMLGSAETKMIGKRIYVEYFNNRDWPMAAALSIAMLVFVVIPFLLARRWQERLEGRR